MYFTPERPGFGPADAVPLEAMGCHNPQPKGAVA